ncbi:MAG: NUDIX domain-containing protein [Propionibacteriaceae bacterium]|jgi:8-oxo-dGTP pyrophosphatase MutT (NUDIX family)|nr:NUDIX domain-containing protein [Propionibacteriaceae bacterium]
MIPDPGQTHAFQPLTPNERPIVVRRATRLIVRTGAGGSVRIFLQHDSDPGAGMEWWMTPGGGLDDDETFQAAGVRELFEETGWTVGLDDLVGPVAHRIVAHGYSDKVLVQEEQFFLVDIDTPLPVDNSGFTAVEVATILGEGWFTAQQLENLRVFPADITRFFAADKDTFVEYGEVDESIIALDERFVPGFIPQLLDTITP